MRRRGRAGEEEGGSTQAQSRRWLSRPRKCSQEGPPHPVVIPQDVEGNALWRLLPMDTPPNMAAMARASASSRIFLPMVLALVIAIKLLPPPRRPKPPLVVAVAVAAVLLAPQPIAWRRSRPPPTHSTHTAHTQHTHLLFLRLPSYCWISTPCCRHLHYMRSASLYRRLSISVKSVGWAGRVGLLQM